MEIYMNYDLKYLMEHDGEVCPECGKTHAGLLSDCLIFDGAILKLPELLHKYNAKFPFVLCDGNTYKAAGERVCEILRTAGIDCCLHIIKREHPSPDERIVGEAMMYCNLACDAVIGVGGGVINDTCKMLSAAKKVPDIIVGTAPSMDGFASATSSMEREGLKISLASKCPDGVIGEPEILAASPAHMIRSGVGDMLAKYVSIVEWQISHLLLGEYYCPRVADMIRCALDKCVKAAPSALSGNRDAVSAVMEGLVISGLAMNYVGISRPASGMEHYISHIIDMRSLEFATPADLHGIQCGIATLATVRAYEKLAALTPDMEKALTYVKSFDGGKWNKHLTKMLGHGAETIIRGEERERKYDPVTHAARLEKIIANWDAIRAIIAQLPASDELERFMKSISHPTTVEEIGLNADDLHEAFLMAKDIRDKYVLGRLLWDLGVIDEF